MNTRLSVIGYRLSANTEHRTPKTEFGFTFVELLVVVTIFSILSLAVYATFSSGMRMWGRIQDTTLVNRRITLRLEKISSDLRQTLNFPKIGFSGKVNEISFPLFSVTGEISRAAYFFEQETLFRKQELYKNIIEEEEKEEVKARLLLSNIEDLKFSFAYKEIDKEDYSWKDEWNKEEGLPIMVKIEIKTKDAEFTKTVIIPIS